MAISFLGNFTRQPANSVLVLAWHNSSRTSEARKQVRFPSHEGRVQARPLSFAVNPYSTPLRLFSGPRGASNMVVLRALNDRVGLGVNYDRVLIVLSFRGLNGLGWVRTTPSPGYYNTPVGPGGIGAPPLTVFLTFISRQRYILK